MNRTEPYQHLLNLLVDKQLWNWRRRTLKKIQKIMGRAVAKERPQITHFIYINSTKLP